MRHPLVTGLCAGLIALTLLLGCAEEDSLIGIGGRPSTKRSGTTVAESPPPSDGQDEEPRPSPTPTAKPTPKPTPTPSPSLPPPTLPEENPTPDVTPSPEPSADFDLEDPDAPGDP